MLAIQITAFPNAGFCIGLAFHHVVADGRTFLNFFNTWASYCAFGGAYPLIKSLPLYDRSVIVDAKGLHGVFLKEYWRERRRLVVQQREEYKLVDNFSSMVRATFLMGATEMEKVKSFIVGYCCKEKNQSQPVHLSAYVLTCAFLWVSLAKTQQQSVNYEVGHDGPTHFGFIAGGITRLDYAVPQNYLGNCVGFGRASVRRKELLGEDGVVVAARAIGSTVKRLGASILEGAEKWVLDWEGLLHGSESEQHVHATWSPKLKLYDESDFGWGRPKKIEEVSNDSTRAVSLKQSRDVEGGIEIGLALPKSKITQWIFSPFCSPKDLRLFHELIVCCSMSL